MTEKWRHNLGKGGISNEQVNLNLNDLTIIRLGFLRAVFSGGDQFDPTPHHPPSYSKKNFCYINITLRKC